MKKIFLILLLLPVKLHAQSCELISSRQFYSIGSGEVVYVGSPVFGCGNGTRITADSAIIVKASNRADFINNVRFTEPGRVLTSQYAQYLSNLRKLQAQGNVIVRDERDGSVLRAPSLDYFQQSNNEPQARVEIYSGRPHFTTFRTRANSNVVDTTNVDSDRMQLIGQNTFRGWGAVVIKRGDLDARSGYAEFVQDSNRMKLTGQAVVISDSTTLKADTIDAVLANGDEFKDVFARKDASMVATNINVTSPRMRVTFDNGDVQRLIAVGGKLAKAAAQAKAVSEDFTLTADSIDARTPNQKLDTVTAVGSAFAHRAPNDSADAKLPELIKQDWVRGENIVATFEDADTARVLKRIVAKGGPASSTYRLREADKKNPNSTKLSINYLTAQTIDVRFKKGEVDKVSAKGQIRGMYLQPPQASK